VRHVAAVGAIITLLALSGTPVSAGTGAFADIGAVRSSPDSGPVPVCFGDCDDDGEVTVDEIIQIVGQILEVEPVTCVSIFPGMDITGAIAAVNSALRGCQAFTYHLTPESTITFSALPPTGPIFVEEPLSGTFVAVPAYHGDPDALLDFNVTSVEFQSASFAVSGTQGRISASSETGTALPFFSVSIAGQPLELCDVSSFSVFSDGCPPALPLCEYPPRFGAMDACATPEAPSLCQFPTMCDAIRAGSGIGYSLRIFAVPEN
jgi:hypothetical protein